MKFLIPAKTASSRCIDKNWRPFYEGRSLVELKISQLKRVASADDIFVSCEDESRRAAVEQLGAQFLLRQSEFCGDDVHWSDLVTHLIGSVPCPDEEDIGWVFPTTPLFDDYAGIIAQWQHVKEEYDCIIAVKQFQHYVVDAKGKPVNFHFGRWHEWSQSLPKWYLLAHPIHIMRKRSYLRCAYYIGTRPYLYEITGPAIDIDYLEEFEAAQAIYAKQVGG